MTASKLTRPSIEYKESFLAAMVEYHKEDHYLYNDLEYLNNNFEEYVKLLSKDRGHPHQPHPEWVENVPETVAWFVKDNEYLGTVDVRHRLNWHLEKWGGHIHFILRPSMRGKGFGKRMLQKAIPIANYLGIEKALLTVDPENKAAIRTVEACGGEYEDTLVATNRFPTRARYWINCT